MILEDLVFATDTVAAALCLCRSTTQRDVSVECIRVTPPFQRAGGGAQARACLVTASMKEAGRLTWGTEEIVWIGKLFEV